MKMSDITCRICDQPFEDGDIVVVQQEYEVSSFGDGRVLDEQSASEEYTHAACLYEQRRR
jgi:hypothetical protein